MFEKANPIAITGLGVLSPYGTGFGRLKDGLLSSRCCLESSTGFYPGFRGTVAQIGNLAPLECRTDFWPSRTDHMAVLAARDALTASSPDSNTVAESGIVIATTVA